MVDMEKFSGDNDQPINKALIWDSGSSLYDSFELNAFKRHLDSVISSRTYSMPHLSHFQLPPPPPPPPQEKSKISRSLRKLLRFLCRSKVSSVKVYRVEERLTDDKFINYTISDRFGALSTISEFPELVRVSSDFDDDYSIIRRTVSERLTSTTSIDIYCTR